MGHEVCGGKGGWHCHWEESGMGGRGSEICLMTDHSLLVFFLSAWFIIGDYQLLLRKILVEMWDWKRSRTDR